MPRTIILPVFAMLMLLVLYLLAWPVPVDPVAWDAPQSEGYTGPFEPNTRLQGLELLPLGDYHGPEDVAVDAQGFIYVAVDGGHIVRLQPDGTRPENWVTTGGRPLGLAFDGNGNLIVADALFGLLEITPDRTTRLLTDSAEGVPIRYANNVDVAADGKIYFSDSSTRFGAGQWGGTFAASLLDILEHGGHGRLLVHDRASGRTRTLLTGLNFANGVAVGHDQRYVLVVETGHYRVQRYWIDGNRRGQSEVLIDNLPGFPDNLDRGLDGRYWIGLISPRNQLIDRLSARPLVRKMIQRLPAFLRPTAQAYGHVAAIDTRGRVVSSLQDPAGAYRLTTGATETPDYLYVSSLVMPKLARLPL